MERKTYPAMLLTRKHNPIPYVVLSIRSFDNRPLRFSIGPYLCLPTPVGQMLQHNMNVGFPCAYLQAVPRIEQPSSLPLGRLMRFELEVAQPGGALYLHLIDNDGIVHERVRFDWARRKAVIEDSDEAGALLFAGAYSPL